MIEMNEMNKESELKVHIDIIFIEHVVKWF